MINIERLYELLRQAPGMPAQPGAQVQVPLNPPPQAAQDRPTATPPEIPESVKRTRAESVQTPQNLELEPMPQGAPEIDFGALTQPLPAATPREYEERVQGWRAWLARPEIQAGLFQFGTSMLQGRRGLVQNVGRSLEQASGAVGRYQASETAELERQRRAGIEEREAQVRERGVGAVERQAGAAETRAQAATISAQAALTRARHTITVSGLKMNNALLNTALREVLTMKQDAELFGTPFTNEDFDRELLHAYTSALRARAGLPPRPEAAPESPGAQGGEQGSALEDSLSSADARVLQRLKAAKTREERQQIANQNRAAISRIRDALRGRK